MRLVLPKSRAVLPENASIGVELGSNRAVRLFVFLTNQIPMKTQHTAALICRVSSREQEQGYSLEAQETLLREHCIRHGLTVKFAWSFSETASKYELRKKFKEFVQEVKRTKVCHIVAEKVDRISRSGSRDSVLIDEWIEADANRHVHLVKQSLDIHKNAPSTTKFVWNMHVAVAKHTADNLSEEVIKAANVMLSKGIWPTKAPIGYIRDRLNAISPIQPDPIYGKFVSSLFSLYVTGEWSVKRLADYMFEVGLRNKQGHKVMPSRIHLMLQDPFYVGKMRFRGKEFPGAHVPLTTFETFDHVQKLLKRSNSDGVIPYRSHEHMLRGLITCFHCGRPLTWEVHGNNTYAYCRKGKECLNPIARKEDEVEAQLTPFITALEIKNSKVAAWIYRALAEDSQDTTTKRRSIRETLVSEQKSLREKSSRLIDLHLEGMLTNEEFETKRDQIDDSLFRAQKTLESLERIDGVDEITPLKVYESARDFAETFLGREPKEKRDIIREMFASISATRTELKPTYTERFRLLANAIQQTNASKGAKNIVSQKPNFETIVLRSGNKKDQPQRVGRPSWLTAWDEFRNIGAANMRHSDSSGVNQRLR